MPIRSNALEFKADLDAFAKKLKKDAQEVQRSLMFELFRRIVMRTPVDTGRAAGSWNISFSPETAEEGIGAEASMARLAALNTEKFGTYYITNNVPYIGVLEYGGYPNPPKKGSYVPGVGYLIKSVDGYSKQAPAGMVRVSIAELEAEVDQIIRGKVKP